MGTAIRQARRVWTCCMCCRTIRIGQFYGQNGRNRECAPCVGIDPVTGKDDEQ